jgi:hypothetical protein
LGEPEAIVAVAYAKALTHDIATWVWWANPSTEIARQLLKHPAIVNGTLGVELSAFLMEFLPFEECQLDVVNTVRLCLQGQLTTPQERAQLWKRAKRKNPYYIGFMHAATELIPEKCVATAQYAVLAKKLSPLLQQQNPYADILLFLQSSQGQKWLLTFKYALHKPVDQDVVISLFIAVNEFFILPWSEFRGVREINTAIHRAHTYCSTDIDNRENCPEDLYTLCCMLNQTERGLLEASLVLSQIGEDTLIPVFSSNDSVGTVMRKRLLPVTTPILERIDILMS